MKFIKKLFKRQPKLYTIEELPEHLRPKTNLNKDGWYFLVDGNRVAAVFRINLDGPQPRLQDLNYFGKETEK